jgi:hypothetical protein
MRSRYADMPLSTPHASDDSWLAFAHESLAVVSTNGPSVSKCERVTSGRRPSEGYTSLSTTNGPDIVGCRPKAEPLNKLGWPA